MSYFDAELAEKNRRKEVVRSLLLFLDMEEIISSKDPEYVKKFFELNPEVVSTLLNMDPIALAEQITGRSYKEDEKGTGMMGIGLHLQLNKFKELALKSTRDTHYGIDVLEFTELLTINGFQRVHQEEFARGAIHNRCKDYLYVWLHKPDGVLLVFDTYNMKSINGGQFYYCWRPENGYLRKNYTVTSSGSWESESEPNWRRNVDNKKPDDLYWRGHHDCREGMFRSIQLLKKTGKFLSPWPCYEGHGTDLGLNTSVDYENAEAISGPGNYTLVDEARKRRYDAFPEDVRNLLNFKFMKQKPL